MANRDASNSMIRTLNWAVYLGCSWTWCIGMFLPVILVSEYGIGAWFIFAIPNVIGAAAMGWTLANPGTSERMVTEHRTACVAFSAVTIAFHLYFLYWLTFIGLMPAAFSITAVLFGLAFGWLGRRRLALDFLLAWLVLCLSLAVFGRGLLHPVFGVEHPLKLDHAAGAMFGLAPVCVFGFFLCPYLDVTFHRARRETSPGPGIVAFAAGLGVVFLLMIVLTLMYAGDFAGDRTPQDRFGSFGGALLVSWVAMHMACQTGFTLAAHLRALPQADKSDSILWCVAAAMLVGAVWGVRQQQWTDIPGLLSGDLIYRLFMSFYGLIFPAYVWICMVPLRGKVLALSRRALVVLTISILLAGPLFWLGFIKEQMQWLIPGTAIVIVARYVAGGVITPARLQTADA